MKIYRTIQPLKLGKGAILHLTDEQATARKLVLRKIDDDAYEATDETQWVAGETFGAEIDVTPMLAGKIELVDEKPETEDQKTRGGRQRR